MRPYTPQYTVNLVAKTGTTSNDFKLSIPLDVSQLPPPTPPPPTPIDFTYAPAAAPLYASPQVCYMGCVSPYYGPYNIDDLAVPQVGRVVCVLACVYVEDDLNDLELGVCGG